jgi:thioredoxin reductase (NADPH)
MYEIAIIGAGPAGASAALFAAKAGKRTIVLDNDQSITKRAWIENHYGIDGIEGPKLLEAGRKQAQKFGAELVSTRVNHIEKLTNGFKLETENGDFEASHVIFASGIRTELAENVGLKLKAGTEPKVKTVIDVLPDGQTSVKGIWAAGAIAGVSVHTIVTSGDGARVAINVISEINGTRYVDHDIIKHG